MGNDGADEWRVQIEADQIERVQTALGLEERAHALHLSASQTLDVANVAHVQVPEATGHLLERVLLAGVVVGLLALAGHLQALAHECEAAHVDGQLFGAHKRRRLDVEPAVRIEADADAAALLLLLFTNVGGKLEREVGESQVLEVVALVEIVEDCARIEVNGSDDGRCDEQLWRPRCSRRRHCCCCCCCCCCCGRLRG